MGRLSKLRWGLRRRGLRGIFADATLALRRPDLAALHRDLRALIERERRENPVTYNAGGRLYQSYGRIGLFSRARNEPRVHPNGRVMTVEDRIEDYGLAPLLHPAARVLDIGSHFGFLSVELSLRAGWVDAIEPNRTLVACGERVAAALGRANVRFHPLPFESFRVGEPYDLVLSLAAFRTHDRGERSDAAEYFSRCRELLRPGGALYYESTTFGCGEKDCEEAARRARAWIEANLEVVRIETPSLGTPLEHCHRERILARRAA